MDWRNGPSPSGCDGTAGTGPWVIFAAARPALKQVDPATAICPILAAMAVPFGRYQLLKKIGSGGMGQVFLARTAGTQGFEKLIVIKRLLPHLAEDEEFRDMFFDEARIAARLNHPNLIQIFDLGEEGGSYFLAMEYVAGEDLRRLERYASSQGRPVPLGLACRIAADAAAGLDYAHKARTSQGQPLGLVHRDVSPQNILVGFDGAVKLIDFGVVKALDRLQHTATGILKGKYPYMSPEQASGAEMDHRSDVFSLGIIFWELLTGARLFKGASDMITIRLVRECQVRPPSSVNPEVTSDLDALVLRALAEDPHARYPDAAAFRLAIEELILANQLQASSAHLVAFIASLYGDRIARESDPSTHDLMNHLEELEPASDSSSDSGAPQSRSTPSPPRARQSREGTALLDPSAPRARFKRSWVLLSLALVLGLVGFLAVQLARVQSAKRPRASMLEASGDARPDSRPPTANAPPVSIRL